MSQIGVITNPALGNIRKVCQIVGAPTTTTISMPLQLEEDVLEANPHFKKSSKICKLLNAIYNSICINAISKY
jgi:hypothetical protein